MVAEDIEERTDPMSEIGESPESALAYVNTPPPAQGETIYIHELLNCSCPNWQRKNREKCCQ